MTQSRKKQILTFLVSLVLTILLPVSIFLAQQRVIFRKRAAGGENLLVNPGFEEPLPDSPELVVNGGFEEEIGKEKILFSSDRDGDGEDQKIYTMNPDGSEVRQLTFNEVDDARASLSPNGTKIAFSRRDSGGKWDLWIMNSDGSNQQMLLDLNSDLWIVSDFSPDGNQIVYSKWSEWLYIVNADGSNNHLLTEQNFTRYPHWADDGKIYFSGISWPNSDIWRINPDGTGLEKIGGTVDVDYDAEPAVCGNYVVFTCHMTHEGDAAEICRMNKDGSGLVELTNNSVEDRPRACSPDGSRIAFGSKMHGGNYDQIYTMDINGGNVVRLTDTSAYDLANDWGVISTGWLRSGDINPQWTSHSCEQFPPCAEGQRYLGIARKDDGVDPFDPYVVSDWIETGENVSGKSFTLSFYAKSHRDPKTISNIGVQRFPDYSSANPWADTYRSIGPIEIVPDQWTHFTRTIAFSHISGTSKIRVVLRTPDDDWPVYYDEVSLKQKFPPPGWEDPAWANFAVDVVDGGYNGSKSIKLTTKLADGGTIKDYIRKTQWVLNVGGGKTYTLSACGKRVGEAYSYVRAEDYDVNTTWLNTHSLVFDSDQWECKSITFTSKSETVKIPVTLQVGEDNVKGQTDPDSEPPTDFYVDDVVLRESVASTPSIENITPSAVYLNQTVTVNGTDLGTGTDYDLALKGSDSQIKEYVCIKHPDLVGCAEENDRLVISSLVGVEVWGSEGIVFRAIESLVNECLEYENQLTFPIGAELYLSRKNTTVEASNSVAGSILGCEAPSECQTDEDCDDGDPCTDDACVGGVCLFSALPDGTSCPGGFCEGGNCVQYPESCNAECILQDFESGYCASAPVVPGESLCEPGETGIGMAQDCYQPPGWVGVNKGCCCHPATEEYPACLIYKMAQTLEIDYDNITVVEDTEVEWPNACLGCPEPDEVCAQVITPGRKIVLSSTSPDGSGKCWRYEYHTAGGAAGSCDSFRLCEKTEISCPVEEPRLSFQIELEARYGKHSADVKFVVKEGGEEVIDETVEVDKNGSAQVELKGDDDEWLSPGTYEVFVKGLQHLRKKKTLEIEVGTEEYTLDFGKALAGDIFSTGEQEDEKGGVINSFDIVFWQTEWSPRQDVESRADINLDLRVNVADFAYIYKNFWEEGDE